MTERREDHDTRDRLERIEAAYRRHDRRTTRILLAIFAVLLVGGAVVTYQQWRTDKVVVQNRVLVIRVTDLVDALTKQSRVIVEKARFSCDGLNQVREFQGEAVELAIRQTQKSLDEPGGLHELESFRPLILAQQIERKTQLRRLRAYTSKFPVPGHPYRVDCKRAHPLPTVKPPAPVYTLDHPVGSRPG